MVETAIIGKMTNINPFNQPGGGGNKNKQKNIKLKFSKYYFRSSIFFNKK